MRKAVRLWLAFLSRILFWHLPLRGFYPVWCYGNGHDVASAVCRYGYRFVSSCQFDKDNRKIMIWRNYSRLTSVMQLHAWPRLRRYPISQPRTLNAEPELIFHFNSRHHPRFRMRLDMTVRQPDSGMFGYEADGNAFPGAHQDRIPCK